MIPIIILGVWHFFPFLHGMTIFLFYWKENQEIGHYCCSHNSAAELVFICLHESNKNFSVRTTGDGLLK